MPENHLPIFRIQDFDALPGSENYFYLNRFANHLQAHQFIQKPHKHNFFIILLLTSGSGTHTIDFRTYPVAPRKVYLLSPGQVHSWQLSGDADGYILFFTPEFYLLAHSEKKLYGFPFFNALLHKPLVTLSAPEEARLLAIVRCIEDEYTQQQLKKDDIIRDYLDILLLLLTRIYYEGASSEQVAPMVYGQLQDLHYLIDSHYKTHQPVTFYAEKLHLTARQLANTCKRVLGKSLTDLIQERLVLEAKRLLVHSDLTVTQLAAELGFFDNSYFARFFKKHTGQTPEQFRSQNQ
ncbi:helix-turn-helix domain-containing protein [Pontibacter liquoris]|uniref:helix-turn-helix domain-containing protein n=1 Tax=Pontibacter liquoris TaxID=2905677 RepID=UPI001FA72332|nr:helix-turn-helix domain-containing protein [Pontibacter liquoris]